MVILITGDTGLLGTNLKNKFKKTKHKIFGASRIGGVDLRNSKATDQLINSIKPDIIYHLAANVDKPQGEVSPIDMTQRNIGIFVNVLRSAINNKVKKIIFASSIAVYGDVKVPYKESGPTEPMDVYGINKLACEQILKVMAKVYKFNYAILRLHNLYGPHQNMNNPYKNVIALIMRRLLEGKGYKLYGHGETRRAFSYIDDVVNIFIQALEKKIDNRTINIGSINDVSMKELSYVLKEVTGIKVNTELVESRKQEAKIFVGDHSLQNEFTSYKETPLKEGLKKTWKWVKKQKLGELERVEDEIYV